MVAVMADCAEIAAGAAHVAADQADLRDARPLLLGPTFALSADPGGADADVIAGRTLINFKAGAALSVVRKRTVYQVVGYALADVDDRIDAVAIHALRSRTRWEHRPAGAPRHPRGRADGHPAVTSSPRSFRRPHRPRGGADAQAWAS
jgi:hypothetical protein